MWPTRAESSPGLSVTFRDLNFVSRITHENIAYPPFLDRENNLIHLEDNAVHALSEVGCSKYNQGNGSFWTSQGSCASEVTDCDSRHETCKSLSPIESQNGVDVSPESHY